MKKKILISSGGSGGHVIPATIFYEHLTVQDVCDNDMNVTNFVLSFVDITKQKENQEKNRKEESKTKRHSP